ncbi:MULTISPECIES: hypothetical protein [Escherichia]|uniref:hypothetical protein n=1 Tax=Escherichia TaxID=561 RepID=UPI000743EF61|nr:MULTISPECIES: hypothetical protein [Escherichia]HCP1356247.1 hypothetical protein [Escherichia coli]
MSPKAIKLLEIFCETELKQSMDTVQFVSINGWETLERLWPLNERFTPRIEQIRTISYRKQFEKDADNAIEDFLMKDDDWSEIPLVVWRVLLERHNQATILCVTNALANNTELMHIPVGLSQSAQTKFAVAYLYYAMKLPYKVLGESQLDIESPFEYLNTRLQ